LIKQEVGEALAPVYRKVLLPSYAVSIAYVLGDTYDKTLQAYRHQLSGRVSECDSGSGSGGSVSGSTSLVTKPSVASVDYSRIAVEAGDTLLWQMLASVTLPGIVEFGIVEYTTLHYNTIHYNTLHYTTPHYTTPHYTTAVHCTLHYTTLHYSSTLYSTVLQ
jgi:hypothetical protein